LQAHQVTSAQIGIGLLTDDQIARLNEHRLGHKGPTDVLSLDVGEAG
jgi:ssRNA-specific RNase YbeY (16S rRNA maturation enzyme)